MGPRFDSNDAPGPRYLIFRSSQILQTKTPLSRGFEVATFFRKGGKYAIEQTVFNLSENAGNSKSPVSCIEMSASVATDFKKPLSGGWA